VRIAAPLVAGLSLAAPVLVLGCGGSVVDSRKAQKLVATTVTARTGARVRSVVCPKGLKAQPGATFTCTVVGTDGTKGVASVRQHDAKGGLRVSAPFLRTRNAETRMGTELLEDEGAAMQVACPEIVALRVGAKFHCKATDGTDLRSVGATITDAQGDFESAAVIDSAKAQEFIAKTVTDQAGVHVKTVACPKDPEARKGATFDCTVTGIDGTSGTVVAIQRDDQGDVRIAAPFLHMREAEASISSQLNAQSDTKIKVTCPEVIVPRAGKTFLCEATDGKVTRKVGITLTDSNGKFTFKLL
jgi:hypothetical protein